MSKDEALKKVFKVICKESLEVLKHTKVIKDSTDQPIEVDISESEIRKEEIRILLVLLSISIKFH